MVLARLSIAAMKVNISKTKIFSEQIEYEGYGIIRQGIQPIRNMIKMNAFLNIKETKTRKVEPDMPIYQFSQLLSQHVVSQK
jgi:hypothetical protein